MDATIPQSSGGPPLRRRLRRIRDRVFWTRWSPRVSGIVATLICLMGLAVAMQNDNPERGAILFIGGAAWTVLGAYHRTRYESPIGAWAVIGGALWLIARIDEAGNRWLFTVGNVISMIDVPAFFLILMTFPAGRLSVASAAVDPATGLVDPHRVRGMRRLVWAVCAWAALSSVWVVFSDNPNPGCGEECVGRNHYIAGYGEIVQPLQILQAVTLVALGALVVRNFERGFRTRDPLHRSAHIPVRVGTWAIVVCFAAFMAAGDDVDLAKPASLLTKITFMLLPVLYGFALYRWNELEEDARRALRMSTATSPGAVEEVLRTELRDPGLRLTLATGEDGPPSGRRTVLRDMEGTPLWVVDHRTRTPDSTLLDDALAWASQRLAPVSAEVAATHDGPAWEPLIAALTEAELTTAILIAQRRSNREIAAELHLVDGTVNNRVSKIYVKLGMSDSSRRERAATMARILPLLLADQRRRS